MAFTNLLNNAVRFTPEGGRIVIGACREEDQILCWVQDNGIGLAGEDLKKIFQEFYQVEGHTVRKQGGMGIGLTIAKGLIEAHDGKIWAESAGPGKGATFKVSLPVVAG
jgi:signal transduction histidine kinase